MIDDLCVEVIGDLKLVGLICFGFEKLLYFVLLLIVYIFVVVGYEVNYEDFGWELELLVLSY